MVMFLRNLAAETNKKNRMTPVGNFFTGVSRLPDIGQAIVGVGVGVGRRRQFVGNLVGQKF